MRLPRPITKITEDVFCDECQKQIAGRHFTCARCNKELCLLHVKAMPQFDGDEGQSYATRNAGLGLANPEASCRSIAGIHENDLQVVS